MNLKKQKGTIWHTSDSMSVNKPTYNTLKYLEHFFHSLIEETFLQQFSILKLSFLEILPHFFKVFAKFYKLYNGIKLLLNIQ